MVQIYVNQMESLLKSLESEAYVNIKLDEAKGVILRKEMFNIILNETCFKIDIIPLDDSDEYEMEKFKRRIRVKFQNREIFIIGPEDLIISKLVWSKTAGSSERQLRDCQSIWKLNQEKLDLDYIRKWVAQLKIENEFNKLAL